ncbi:MAG: hypothetical protein M3Z66_24915 [Chloroflexota bacterium]|nr:hypothetical protein [Chloroflexota bacterium]
MVGAAGGAGIGDVSTTRSRGIGAALRGAPQSAQNFLPGTISAPHAEHSKGSVAPHSAQNFFPPGETSRQRGQITASIVPSSYQAHRGNCRARLQREYGGRRRRDRHPEDEDLSGLRRL